MAGLLYTPTRLALLKAVESAGLEVRRCAPSDVITTHCLESRWSSLDDRLVDLSSTIGAGDGDRTRGPLLGKQMLYH